MTCKVILNCDFIIPIIIEETYIEKNLKCGKMPKDIKKDKKRTQCRIGEMKWLEKT